MNNNIFHLVEPSPWPIITSLSTNIAFISIINILNTNSILLTLSAILTLLISSLLWWSTVNRESSLQGIHNNSIYDLFNIGIALFISSEVLLFTSIFWNFYHLSFEASIAIFENWPPNSFSFTNPYLFPIYGTILLISSSIIASNAHHATTIPQNNFSQINNNLINAIIMGFLFLDIQLTEYSQSNSALISFNQNPFSSIFFITTGLHGSHVLVGLLYLSYILYFSNNNYLSNNKHSSIIIAIWYWHFVDIIWLFVYYNLYYVIAYYL